MADAIDLRLSPGSRELDLSGGQLHFVSGLESVRQDLETVLAFVRGEWFLEPDAVGIPIFDRVLVKNPNLSYIRSVYAEALRARAHVTAVSELKVTLDRANRTLKIAFVVTTDLGGTVSGSVG